MVESPTEMSFQTSVHSENQQWGHGGAANSSQKVSSAPADDEHFTFEAEVRNAQKRSINTSKVESLTGMSFHPSAPEENWKWGHDGAVNSSQKVSSALVVEKNLSLDPAVRNAEKCSADTGMVESMPGMSFQTSVLSENQQWGHGVQ